MVNTKVKICGMINELDIEAVNKYLPDYVGFVLFFPKSKRNLNIEQAKELIQKLDVRILKVAVVVSPTREQVEIISETGFDYIQIHGELTEDTLEGCSIPIIKAFNVTDLDNYEKFVALDNIKGFVFDANEPGSGKTFDWNVLNNLPKTNKLMFLSGGLDSENVKKAIAFVNPDVVDISSNVEYRDKPGKDPEKIRKFIEAVRS